LFTLSVFSFVAEMRLRRTVIETNASAQRRPGGGERANQRRLVKRARSDHDQSGDRLKRKGDIADQGVL
jgi:hypothetical protein